MPDESRTSPLSVLVLGTDAVLAALPATPVQLAHACLRAGYAAVVPASWGDELVATECLRRVAGRGHEPVIACSCPHVADRLLAAGPELTPFIVSLVAPPVAAARYLRSLVGDDKVRITFVGRCPAGGDPSIDARLLPEEFLELLAQRGIVLAEQPQVFDSVLPPDRRRFRSLPGGVPAPEALWTAGGARALIEIDDDDYVSELAQRLIAREPAVLDLAPKLGCTCSGALPGVAPRSARVAVAALEPPRAPSAVIDQQVPVDLVQPLTPSASHHGERTRVPAREEAASQRAEEREAAPSAVRPQPVERPAASPAPVPLSRAPTPPAAKPEPAAPGPTVPPPAARAPAQPPLAASESTPPRRRSPAGGVRPVVGAIPTVNSGEGRALPRAYVARRRTGRTPPDNEAIAPAGPAREGGRERERQIRASVEPPAAIRAARTAVARARVSVPADWASVRTLMTRPSALLVAGIALLALIFLIGLLAGRAFAPAASARSDAQDQAPVLQDESGDVAAPAPASAAPSTRAPATSRRGTTGRAGTTSAGAPPRDGRPRAATPLVVADTAARARDTTTAAAARGAADTARRPVRDSATAAELEAIRRELEERRVRLDSIARATDSLGRRPGER